MLDTVASPSGDVDDGPLGVAAAWAGSRSALRDDDAVWNEARTIGLLWAGELYSEIPPNGRDARHRVLELYEARGPECLRTLNGWFAGLLLDRNRKEVRLFTDRFGLGRLYVHRHAGTVFFASEAKALLRHAVPHREWDWRSLAEFVALGCALQDRTLYRGISLLPAATVIVHAPGTAPTTRRYFDVGDWAAAAPLSPAQYEAEVAARFPSILRRYLGPPDDLGISLTGGLDTRMIMAWLPPGHESAPCYTFGSELRDSRDVTVARAVARAAGHAHHCIPVGADFLRAFPRLAARTVYVTDGAMDVSGAAGLYANECAAHIRPTRLTGNYGSEILRSVVAFGPERVDRRLFTGDFARLLDEAAATYRTERGAGDRAFVALKQVPWHHYARFALERSALTVRSPYLDNDLVALAFRAPPDAPEARALAVIARGSPCLVRLPTDRALTVSTPWGLRSATHPGHHVSFKAEYAYDVGMPNVLARVDRALRRWHCERLVLGRHRFDHFRVWYRDTLAAHVKSSLIGADGALSVIGDRRVIEAAVTAHVQGRANYTREIHKLLTVQLIDRLLMAPS